MPENRKGNLNRLIRATNQKLREIARRIKELWKTIQEAKAQLEKEEQAARQSPNLIEILKQYLEQRNAGAWSNRAKVKNLQDFAQLFNMLYERRLVTLADFENYMRDFQDKSNTMTAELKKMSVRMKELSDLIRYVDDFKRLKPLYEELNAIKFKRSGMHFIPSRKASCGCSIWQSESWMPLRRITRFHCPNGRKSSRN